MIARKITLPTKASFFLFGARQTGKSTLIGKAYTKHFWKVDLLLAENLFAYAKDPALFRRQADEQIVTGKARTVIIDEIQRVPALLNEIQALMAAHPTVQFVMTGSSARKIRRGGANLLGGRAIERHLYPFLASELGPDFQLEDALQFGTLPALFHHDRAAKVDLLTAYTQTYLKEEIQSEGLARNLGGFSRFLDIAASQCGEILSYSATARECQLPVRTVQSYYDILEDTLIGMRLAPWGKSLRRRLVGHPKFYLFDTGVANAVNRRLTAGLDPATRGRLFEQWVVLETQRILSYRQSEARLYYWRTNHGAEVDLLIEKHGHLRLALEIKATAQVAKPHLSGLNSFREEYPKTPRWIVSLAPHPYRLDEARILPWKVYLEQLQSYI